MRDTEQAVRFRVGYNLTWRLTFVALGLFMIVTSILQLVDKLTEGPAAMGLPISMLIASVFLGLYLVPLITSRPQTIGVSNDGLTLFGEQSTVTLPWEAISDVRFKRVMFLMRYLVIALADKEPLVRFLDQNPRSFLARWTGHVGVFRRYPWLLRKLLSVPKAMTTMNKLEWLERRYGGAIVIDSASANGRGRQLENAVRAHIAPAVSPITPQPSP